MPGMSKTSEGSPPDPWILSTSLALKRKSSGKDCRQSTWPTRIAFGCFNPSNLIAARLSSMGKAYNSWGALKACSAWNSLGGGSSMASRRHNFPEGLHWQLSRWVLRCDNFERAKTPNGSWATHLRFRFLNLNLLKLEMNKQLFETALHLQ